MITQSITYTDYFGRERTEEFAFNLTKTELVKLSTSDFKENVEKISSSQANDAAIIDLLRTLILTSYGRISMDGSRFEKSEELRNEFEQSAAYDALFMDLAQHPDKFQTFFSNVVPADMKAEFVKSFSTPQAITTNA